MSGSSHALIVPPSSRALNQQCSPIPPWRHGGVPSQRPPSLPRPRSPPPPAPALLSLLRPCQPMRGHPGFALVSAVSHEPPKVEELPKRVSAIGDGAGENSGGANEERGCADRGRAHCQKVAGTFRSSVHCAPPWLFSRAGPAL